MSASALLGPRSTCDTDPHCLPHWLQRSCGPTLPILVAPQSGHGSGLGTRV